MTGAWRARVRKKTAEEAERLGPEELCPKGLTGCLSVLIFILRARRNY